MAKNSKKNNNFKTIFFILVLASGFYYREQILSLIFKAKKAKSLSELVDKNHYVKVLKLKGNIGVTKSDFKYHKLDMNYDLEIGDIILTSNHSFLTVSFGSNLQNQFTLGPDSSIEIKSLFSSKEGIKAGTLIQLEKGGITSKLIELEGAEYKISTGKNSFVAKDAEFFVKKMENEDDLLVVKSGLVETSRLLSKKKIVVKKEDVFFLFTADLSLPLSDKLLLRKIHKDFDNLQSSDNDLLYNIYSSIVGKIDKVKIILTIKDRITKIGKFLETSIKSNQSKVNRFLFKASDLAIESKEAQKVAEIDIKCLKAMLNCILKSEAVLLKRGMVLTSGRRKYNKESIENLKAYLKEYEQKIELANNSSKKIASFVKKQKNWLLKIKKMEGVLHPENGFVEPKLIDYIVSLNKEIKDKELKRFMEMAKWVPVIEVLE